MVDKKTGEEGKGRGGHPPPPGGVRGPGGKFRSPAEVAGADQPGDGASGKRGRGIGKVASQASLNRYIRELVSDNRIDLSKALLKLALGYRTSKWVKRKDGSSVRLRETIGPDTTALLFLWQKGAGRPPQEAGGPGDLGPASQPIGESFTPESQARFFAAIAAAGIMPSRIPGEQPGVQQDPGSENVSDAVGNDEGGVGVGEGKD